jgi:hypothetical protein
MTIQVGDTVRAVPVDPDPSYWVHSEGYLWLVTWVSIDRDLDAPQFSYFVEFQYLATGRKQRWGVHRCELHPNRWLAPATRFYLEKADVPT